MTTPVLGSLGRQILAHWREHRPRMVMALELEHKLIPAVHAAEQLTLQEEAELMMQGMKDFEARELTREKYAFLPDEEDVPDLASDPRAWTAPPDSTTTSLTTPA
jgi:transposase